MLANILWGIACAAAVAGVVMWEIRKKRRHRGPFPHLEKTENEKAVEQGIAIEKERSRRYPPGGGGL